MENTGKKNHLQTHLRLLLRNLLSLKSDKAPEEETIERIRAGIDFKGANLWVLIFAIFVASLGLNTNSAAVIIGAMLISPLMGPIVGMGLGVGINDFEMLKRAFKSFTIASIFSVLTATFYFSITPIAEAQSELLARTSPTIYDVLIALFGGLAGIVALCSSGQRGGNVIPGVAIATALMPPLCTTGFGIATGNWLYAAGAFYLYIINSFFISCATFIGVNIMNFKKKVFVDKQREKHVKQIIISIAVLTMIPATYLTYTLVKENIYTTKVNSFINHNIASDRTQIISKEIDYNQQSVRVITIGEEIPEEEIGRIRNRLERYGLEDVELSIVQGTKNLTASELKTMLIDPMSKQADKNAQLLANEQQKVALLEKELTPYRFTEQQARQISAEIQPLFPEVNRVSMSQSISYATADSAQQDTLLLVLLTLNDQLSEKDNEKLQGWLNAKFKSQKIKVITEIYNNN